jgi:hypothetical protein
MAILIVTIAGALQHLELKPGVPLPPVPNGVGQPKSEPLLLGKGISFTDFWKAVMSLALLVAIIYTGYQLLRHATWSWRDAAKSLAQIGVLFVIVACILWALLSGVSAPSEPVEEIRLPPAVEQAGPPLGPVPQGLIWLVGLGLVATLIGVGLWILLRPAGRASTDRLALQVELALQALSKGVDLKNVIVRCYWEMGQVLKQEQGLEMEAAMTVREFERLLEARGVPHLPVHQLTQLFEMARYGHQAVSADDERQAVDALTTIVQYCRATRP